jgi:hypothetical protein
MRPKGGHGIGRRSRLLPCVLLISILGAAVLPSVAPPVRAVEETSGLESLLPRSERRAPASAPLTAPSAATRSADPNAPPGAGVLSGMTPRNIAPAASEAGGWARLKNFPLVRRVCGVGNWIGCLARFLVSIPKAVFKGDSRGMISALGELLSRSARPAEGQDSPSLRDEKTDPPRGTTNFSIQ